MLFVGAQILDILCAFYLILLWVHSYWHSLCILSDDFCGCTVLDILVCILSDAFCGCTWILDILCENSLNLWMQCDQELSSVRILSVYIICTFPKKFRCCNLIFNFSAVQTFLNAVHIRILLQLAVLRISSLLYLTTAWQFILKFFFGVWGKCR